jgi:hypothetical protein
MNSLKILLCLLFFGFMGCAQMGLKPHQPEIKSTIEIAKSKGMYRIVTVKGATPAMDQILNNDLMNCNSTTFSMPRGNTVASFIREIDEQELRVADKYSANGNGIDVVVKSMIPETSNPAKGTWTLDIDYIENGKTTNVKTINEFESKYGAVASCVNTADIFEKALAGNFVDYFIKTR